MYTKTISHILFSFLISCLVSVTYSTYAQDSASSVSVKPAGTISILTCGVGDELYASFGHSGIRYKDTVSGIDMVYNYGTFDFSDPSFYQKFVLGKLDYFLSTSSYEDFMVEYREQGRSVQEQMLQLSSEEVQKVVHFLEDNLTPEKRFYKYDFIYDNCATRIRDVFPLALGNKVTYGNILRDSKVSYRRAINSYIMNNHWSRVGINLLFGATVDSNMTDHTSMFLPDYLHEGFKGSQLDAENLVLGNEFLVKKTSNSSRKFNGPFWLSIAILLLTFFSYHIRSFGALKPVMNTLILAISGLLGIFMLFMWLGTAHHSCSENYNVLWALPTNAIMAILALRPRRWHKFYGLIGITLLFVSLIIHAMGIQELPLIEIVPFLGALAYVYLDIYKSAIQLMVQDASSQQTLQ